MAGGLFAANREFFESIGAYDELFSYWGTENVELGFRLWQCGGVLECAPCSRVYHIFRKGGVGYSSPPDATTKNKMRTLAIWMDEYADLAWRVQGRPKVDYGEIETMKRFRRENNCKSMNWFMHEIFPESFVLDLPDDVPYLGRLKHRQTKTCMDNHGHGSVGGRVVAGPCHGGQTQQFMYFRRPQHIMPVSNDEACLDKPPEDGSPWKTEWCQIRGQFWRVHELGSRGVVQLQHASSGQCLQLVDNARQFALDDCDAKNEAQVFEWDLYNPPSSFEPPKKR